MRRGTQESGVGTLEVMVALSLYGLVLVGLTGLLVGSISAGTVAETSSVASHLARQRLDELCGMTVIVGGTPTAVIEAPPGGRDYTVQTVVSPPAGNVMNVSATVTWQVAFGSACAGRSCAGNMRTLTRRIQAQVSAFGPKRC